MFSIVISSVARNLKVELSSFRGLFGKISRILRWQIPPFSRNDIRGLLGRFSRKLSHIVVIVPVLLFLGVSFANAQSTRHSFHDLENLVAKRDYSVAANLLRLQAVEHKHAATRSQLWPEFSTFYRYYQDGLAIIDENDFLSATHLFNLRLSQDLIKMTKIRSGKLKQLGAEKTIAQLRLDDSRGEALLNFRKEYLGILADSARCQAYQKLIDVSQELLDLKNARYENQEGLYTEVLKVEAELIHLKGMLAYHQNDLKNRKKFLAEYFTLNQADIHWNEIRLKHAAFSEATLLRTAIKNSSAINSNEARKRLEASRASTAIYDNFSLSPYVGYRFRGDRFSEFRAGPEVGVRFSLPLGFINFRKHTMNRFGANEIAWKLEAERSALGLKRDITFSLNEYELLSTNIENTAKLLDHINERIRIERARIEKAPKNIKLAAAALPELEAEKIKLELQIKIYGYEHDEIYYEIIHLAGISGPENFVRQSNTPIAGQTKRALWVWNASELWATPASGNDFIAFCKKRNVNHVFLSLNKELVPELQNDSSIADFIIRLHEKEFEVSALFGEPLWVFKQNRNNLLKKIETVLDYNSNNEQGQFDAIHLDIEPHTLPEWSADKTTLLNNLTETLAAVKQIAGSKIRLEIDLPTFYHNVDENTLKKIIELADTVTIMAYERKSVEKVMAGVNFIAEHATQMNKHFIIGLNAKEFKEEHILQNLIDNVSEEFNSTNGFKGFAIHDYRNYRNLVER